jgi:hypothetical protein
MKKTEFTGRPNFAVAMSRDTGCIVMTRTLGAEVSVMGSLTREQSLSFARSLLDWKPEEIQEAVKEVVRPKLTVVN